MSGERYERLLQPGCIGSVKTKSRLIKTGANPGFYPYDDGIVHQRIVDYYEAVAAGGVGLVTVGAGEIDYPIGTVPNWGYRHDDERYVPSLQRLTDAIHRYDCPAFIQLFHMGPMHPAAMTGLQHIAASSLSLEELPRKDFTPGAKEMTRDEIERVKGRFVNAAVVAQKAGFDGIELNFACNHLGNSFLSKAWNRRHDEYGCDSLENRARFLVETITGIRDATGKDFGLSVMINSLEAGLKDGITLEECKAFAVMSEKAGADAIHPRVEFYTNPKDILKRDSTHFPDMVPYPSEPANVEKEIDLSRHGKAAWVPGTAEVKKVVSVPVVAVGRLDPDLGESILRDGKADFISHNRRLMADHELPRKIAEGRPEDIAPCTACMTCFARVEHGMSPQCRTNAALGKEREYEIKPAARKKKVMVVGGGPAALEAARVAALRGHTVSLYTAMSKLGGSTLVAAVVKGTDKEDLIGFARYYETQMKKLGVEVHRGTKVTPALVKAVGPDVLLVASGARHDIPEIPGIDSRKVMTSEKLHHQLKFFLRFAGPRFLRWGTKFALPLMLGKEVVVIGGRLHGCQTAEFLVKRGRKVTIVDSCPPEQIGEGLLETFIKPWLLLWLDDRGVKIVSEARYEEITKEGLVITTKDGGRQTLRADKILTALPMLPDTEFFNSFQGAAEEVRALGDAREPSLIVDAVADGAKVGREI
ncbi:MAG: FAD-dependent oxidoreductase [Actinobacteria bacterium]|nr:FAD-dependent oxidoreductase [Actinomycetota bacterium]